MTITLPGPPVAYAIDPARLVAWLVGRGYALTTSHPNEPAWLAYQNEHRTGVLLPNPSEWEAGEYAVALAESVGEAAETAGMAARDLAAQLGPEGPALQWAHANADTRAPVLALLDSEAADSRHNAAVARAEGKTAVLRGGGRG